MSFEIEVGLIPRLNIFGLFIFIYFSFGQCSNSIYYTSFHIIIPSIFLFVSGSLEKLSSIQDKDGVGDTKEMWTNRLYLFLKQTQISGINDQPLISLHLPWLELGPQISE